MRAYDSLYIDGQWVPSTGSGTIDVVNASTEEVMGSIPEGTPEDVDRAVAAAKAAFESWSTTDAAERAKVLQALADGLGARNQEIAETITGEVGMPLFLSQLDPGRSADRGGRLATSGSSTRCSGRSRSGTPSW